MDRISSNSDENENDEMRGYEPSPSSSSSSSVSLDQQVQNNNNNDQSPLTTTEDSFFRTSSEVSAFSEHTDDSSYSDSPSPVHWPAMKSPKLSRLGMKQHNNNKQLEDCKSNHDYYAAKQDLELDMMKERFSKLLLGQDMSGSGKGVTTSVAISNAITNLYASIFGHHLRLEPLHPDKKLMWRREMNCLLSICDYIVELIPVSHDLKDGTALEVMSSRPRSDIGDNLPALKKLDAMLLDVLDSFEETEFWYVDQGSISSNSTNSGSGSFRRIIIPASQRKDEKWWLPVPCVSSPGGLTEESRKHLRYQRDCTNQIHKAAKALNNSILLEMDIPDSYLISLPKSGKAIVGDTIYKYMCTADNFVPDFLLDNLKVRSEHEALELADKIEASMYTWRRKAGISHTKTSWDMVKDLMSEMDRSDKNHVLAERAESLLFCLKQRYPQLSQTSLDTTKIQHNRDVGKAILESYSRVLEGLAFNMVAWIDDVLFVDKTVRNQDL